MITNPQERNLLLSAAENGNAKIVKFLLQTFDVNHTVKKKSAIDLAYEKKHFDVILVLLKANSRFPLNIKIYRGSQRIPDDLRKFIESCMEMHEAIDSLNEEKVLKVIEENPHVRHFYDRDNNSVLATAIRKHALSVYKLLITKNICLGPHEILDDILRDLSKRQRRELRNFNHANRQTLIEPHILVLLANSNVGFDDSEKQLRISHVLKAFQYLNEIEHVKILLEFVAATRDFQLVFDFNRNHVQFLDPSQEPYTNGSFYLNGRIFIAAMELLNENLAHEIYAVIAHELCHFVMYKVKICFILSLSVGF